MKIKLIVAHDLANGIGKNNDLLWHLPKDMAFFKKQTTGHVVIMGRKNFESIPEKFRPLPNRTNVIITRDKTFPYDNCLVFNDIRSCVSHFEKLSIEEVYVIGGGQIYQEFLALNCIDEMYITIVKHSFEADTFFPEINKSEWDISIIDEIEIDEKNKYAATIYHYKKK